MIESNRQGAQEAQGETSSAWHRPSISPVPLSFHFFLTAGGSWLHQHGWAIPLFWKAFPQPTIPSKCCPWFCILYGVGVYLFSLDFIALPQVEHSQLLELVGQGPCYTDGMDPGQGRRTGLPLSQHWVLGHVILRELCQALMLCVLLLRVFALNGESPIETQKWSSYCLSSFLKCII